MLCRLGGCNKESYTDDGISTWVYGPYLAAQWLVGLPSILLGISLVLVTVARVLFNLVEALLFHSYMSYYMSYMSGALLLLLVSSGLALISSSRIKGKIKNL